VGRCSPIAKRLQENGAEIMFTTYLTGLDYVKKEEFRVLEVPPIDFSVEYDGTIDFRQTMMEQGPFVAPFTILNQIKSEIKAIMSFDPDIVVSDSRVAPLIAAKFLGIPSVSILNQFQILIPRRTKFLRIGKFVDAGALALIGGIWTSAVHVLIPDFPPPYTISTGNLRLPSFFKSHIKLVGPILPKLPQELESPKKIRKKLGLDENKSFVFAPISGPPKECKYLIKKLIQIFKEFSDEFQIVMSLGLPDKSNTIEKEGNLIIHNWISNRFEYLKACDVLIARAGHETITQSISYGKPQILIPTPNHSEQLNNAKKAVDIGIAEIIEQENLTKRTILESIRRIDVIHARERREQIQKEISNINGIETAAKIIMDVAGEREPMNSQDSLYKN